MTHAPARRVPSTRTAAVVLAAGVTVYFVAVMHRTALGVAGVEALDRFGLQATGLALLSVLQIAAYAGMQIPAGTLLDRFGPRTMMIAGSLVMAVGQGLLAFTDSFAVALVARLLIGAGDAPIFIAACRIIAFWFPPRRVPVLVQITGLIGQTGQLASAIAVAWVLHSYGWTAVFATLAIVGVGAAGVAAVGVRTPAPADGPVDVIAARERFWTQVRHATTPSGTRLGFWSHFVSPFSANVVALLWGVPFFIQAQGLTATQASTLLTILTLAAMVAGPVAGVLTARHPLRRTWIVLGSSIATLVAWVVLLAFSTPRPMWQLAIFVAVIGAGGPVSLVGMDFARTFTPAERLGTATGFVNVGGFASTIVAVLGVGLVLQLAAEPGATAYTLGEYRLAFSSLLIPWVIGVVGVVVHRRRTRQEMQAEGIIVPPLRDVMRRRLARN